MSPTPKKINFKLHPDSDGYPPATVESLWANPAGELFEIDSIPFFTSEATVGDLVQASPDSNGALWFDCTKTKSHHSLIRVVFFEPQHEARITSDLQGLGCGTEGMKVFKLLAIDIPASVPLVKVQNYLQSESQAGHIDYEEALLRQ